jgi:hypothetical protein
MIPAREKSTVGRGNSRVAYNRFLWEVCGDLFIDDTLEK